MMKDKKWKLKWKARRQLRDVKAQGLHLSPSFLSNEKKVTKNMTPFKRNMSHSASGNPFILLESCLTVNGQSMKSKQNCRRFSRETKNGGYTEIIYPGVSKHPKIQTSKHASLHPPQRQASNNWGKEETEASSLQAGKNQQKMHPLAQRVKIDTKGKV